MEMRASAVLLLLRQGILRNLPRYFLASDTNHQPSGLSSPLRSEPSDEEHRARRIVASGFFDAVWYCEKNTLKFLSETDAALDYVRTSEREVRRFHPLCDNRWLEKQLLPNQSNNLTLLERFLEAEDHTHLSPSPIFSPDWYKSQVEDQSLEGRALFLHFLRAGSMNGLSPHPLFDSRYYIDQDPSLASSKTNPLTHYVEIGARNGKNPNQYFDSGWYLRQHPELIEEGVNPLAHFIEVGARAGLHPHPNYDLDLYILNVSDAPDDRLEAYEPRR